MKPLVELPLLFAAELVQLRELCELLDRFLKALGLDECRDVEPSDEWPDAAVVVVVGLVEVANPVVVPPVVFPLAYDGVQYLDWIGLVEADLVDVVEYTRGLFRAGDTHDDGE